MEEDDDGKANHNTWRVDDLDGGLAAEISNLQGLGNQPGLISKEHTPAYDMTRVLQLQLFKEEALDANDLLQSLNESIGTPSGYIQEPLQQQLNSLNSYQTQDIILDNFREEDATPIKPDSNSIQFDVNMKAPTAPGRKICDETLTWLNQGQPYEVIMRCISDTQGLLNTKVKGIISIGFHERQHQYFEYEKYEEWVLTRPNEKMIELDVPMCFNVFDVSYIGTNTNEIEFLMDPSSAANLFVKVNCLSSEFTKGKGESGVPLRLQLEIFKSPDASSFTDEPDVVAGCQVKVFRAKGANRKLKLEKEKHESLSKEVAIQVQASSNITLFKKVGLVERLRRRSFDTPLGTTNNEFFTPLKSNNEFFNNVSPTQISTHQIVNGSANNSISSPDSFIATNHQTHSQSTLTANSDVEETQTWLTYHRFQNYLACFANFTGADLLRMSRSDFIQLCGPADGIRLNNALQARASRPLLTMYISPEWHQSGTGMREYHAMFLEQLTLHDLKRILAKKCGLHEDNIVGILKQGPTGIHIHIDDDVVRNFVDESHYVVEVVKDTSGHSRIVLK